jgi:predicted secreted protein
MYALINDRQIPVDSLKSIVARWGTIVVSGKAVSEEDRKSVREVFSTLQKKDLVSFNVVTSDWQSITGNAVITDLAAADKSKKDLPFFITMKQAKSKKPSRGN